MKEPVVRFVASINHIMSNDKRKKYDDRHGGPWDRGSADAYYHRPKDPHKYPDPRGTGFGERVKLTDPEEIEAYNDGYDNETERK